MKLMIGTLLSSISQLGEILVFSAFFFFIFAILGVSLWEGLIHYRCRETPEPINGDWVAIANDTRICGWGDCPVGTCGSLFEADKLGLVGNVTDLRRDTKLDRLNWSFTAFDNVPQAFLTIFQSTTAEGWTDIIEIYQDAYYPFIV